MIYWFQFWIDRVLVEADDHDGKILERVRIVPTDKVILLFDTGPKNTMLLLRYFNTNSHLLTFFIFFQHFFCIFESQFKLSQTGITSGTCHFKSLSQKIFVNVDYVISTLYWCDKCMVALPRELILSASSLKTALYLTRAFSYSPFRNNFSPSAITAAGNILTDISIVNFLVVMSHKNSYLHWWICHA